jgi:hypothetical protein
MARLLWIALALAALAALFGAGCMLVTGSTDGYVERTCGCQAGQVCCLTISLDDGGVGDGGVGDGGLGAGAVASHTSCQDQACSQADFQIQMCSSSAECGNGGTCFTESCSYQGANVTLQACSLVPTCTLSDP